MVPETDNVCEIESFQLTHISLKYIANLRSRCSQTISMRLVAPQIFHHFADVVANIELVVKLRTCTSLLHLCVEIRSDNARHKRSNTKIWRHTYQQTNLTLPASSTSMTSAESAVRLQGHREYLVQWGM